jgi:serralysin
LVPTPVFDYTYSWGVQNGDQTLKESPALQPILLTHNGG